jgi:type II secretory pathway component PulM
MLARNVLCTAERYHLLLCVTFLQALQLQASSKAELAQLPGLQDRLAVLQQQLTDAESARAAAQQALLESTDKLQRAQRRSTALAKVCLQ